MEAIRKQASKFREQVAKQQQVTVVFILVVFLILFLFVMNSVLLL